MTSLRATPVTTLRTISQLALSSDRTDPAPSHLGDLSRRRDSGGRDARADLHDLADLAELADLADLVELVGRGGVLALTGAGLSTDSGIPDYRGPDGQRRVTPMTIEEFRSGPDGRQRYWSRAYIGWARFRAAEPNDGHRAVARLEEAGLLDGVITQNVDGLHQASGSTAVRELHGTLTRVVCLVCGARVDRDRLQAALTRLNPGFAQAAQGPQGVGTIRPDGDVDLAPELVRQFRIARCEDCGSDQLKPDVVYFGESVPRPLVAECFQAVEDCASLLVLGSSLAVMSGLRFVRRAAALGRPVAIVTRGPSRGDDLCTLRVDAPLGRILPQLADTLTGSASSESAENAE